MNHAFIETASHGIADAMRLEYGYRIVVDKSTVPVSWHTGSGASFCAFVNSFSVLRP